MSIRKFSTYLLITLLTGCIGHVRAQSLAVKTNLLGWSMMMPNLGVDIVANECSSWDMSVYQSMSDGWLCDINATALQVGYRYWFGRQPLDQFFLGATATGAHYKAAVGDTDRRGVAVPVGLNIGYAWPLGRRWNLEISYGMGMTWLSEEVKDLNQSTHRRYDSQFTPTNFGLNLSYLLR